MALLPYPSRWKLDTLRALDYFQKAELPYDSRVDDALHILLEKRKPDGRRLLQSKQPGAVHFGKEKPGQPSRWIALSEYKFNPVPVYIVLVPLIALLTSRFAVEKAAALSRESIIVKTQPLLAAIDEYKVEHGNYPEALEVLEGKYTPQIPAFHIMGIRAYQYEKQSGSFQLSFEQLWHWSATEVVVYNATGEI